MFSRFLSSELLPTKLRKRTRLQFRQFYMAKKRRNEVEKGTLLFLSLSRDGRCDKNVLCWLVGDLMLCYRPVNQHLQCPQSLSRTCKMSLNYAQGKLRKWWTCESSVTDLLKIVLHERNSILAPNDGSWGRETKVFLREGRVNGILNVLCCEGDHNSTN